MKEITWTKERVNFLIENYPLMGRIWCANAMGLRATQIRMKASRLQIKANGVSEAWKQKQVKHSIILTGRKRPAQAKVMKDLHLSGKLKKTPEQRKAFGERSKAWIALHGHPRGALGIKHSEKTLAILSEKSKIAWGNKTKEQIMLRTRKILETRVKNGTYAPDRKKTTWKAGWRDIGGKRKYYRSQWEANYAYYLEWLKNRGDILDWAHEPKVFWFEGIKRGAVSYLPDFCVKENNGSESYHEVKGWMDERSRTKIKRMAKYFPDIKLIVIDAKVYESMRRKISSLVPNWES